MFLLIGRLINASNSPFATKTFLKALLTFQLNPGWPFLKSRSLNGKEKKEGRRQDRMYYARKGERNEIQREDKGEEEERRNNTNHCSMRTKILGKLALESGRLSSNPAWRLSS